MGVPKKRHSKTRRNSRRANHERLTPHNVTACPTCGEPKLPHRICPSCGSYRGTKIIETSEE